MINLSVSSIEGMESISESCSLYPKYGSLELGQENT